LISTVSTEELFLKKLNEPPFPVERYLHQDDLYSKLHNTVVRYKGDPVIVQVGEGIRSMHTHLKYLKTGKKVTDYEGVIHCSNPLLDISSPPLGYCNYGKNSYYTNRLPVRRYRTGLASENLYVSIARPTIRFDDDEVSSVKILKSKELSKTILGEYPSFKECLDFFDYGDNFLAIAFDRKYCIVKDEIGILKLKHLNRSIGFMAKKDREFTLIDDWTTGFFLKDLKEKGANVVIS
jgi:hypothetical protein